MSGPDRDPIEVVATPANERTAMISPDERWLAYVSNESGIDEVYVRAFPGPGPKAQISRGGGAEPVWDPSGESLYFRRGGKLLVVEVERAPALRAGAATELFEGPYLGGDWHVSQYDVTGDGNRFLMIEVRAGEVEHVSLVLGWDSGFEELFAGR